MVIEKISSELNEICKLSDNLENDALLFKNERINFDKKNFYQLIEPVQKKELIFIDGGQSELLVASNFALAYLRVAAVGYFGCKKTITDIREGYLLVSSKGDGLGNIIYSARIFSIKGDIDKLIDLNLLSVDSNHELFKSGFQRGNITKMFGMVRRFLELKISKEYALKKNESLIVMDGTLDQSYPNEDKILSLLPENVSALAKSSQLFTVSGGSPTVALSKMNDLSDAWYYSFTKDMHFVKLHPNSRHLFRFTGNSEEIVNLLELSVDPIFLGYPYGLIMVDKLARVSEMEKRRFKAKFLLRKELSFLKDYLSSQDAHSILDSIG